MTSWHCQTCQSWAKYTCHCVPLSCVDVCFYKWEAQKCRLFLWPVLRLPPPPPLSSSTSSSWRSFGANYVFANVAAWFQMDFCPTQTLGSQLPPSFACVSISSEVLFLCYAVNLESLSGGRRTALLPSLHSCQWRQHVTMWIQVSSLTSWSFD